MKILIIYAHPEPQSLNGSLRDFSVAHLRKGGHEVQVSDLYAIDWNPVVTAADGTDHTAGDEPFNPARHSRHAFTTGTQSADIAAEQAKLAWADTVLFQFPLWWFSMPAIMKGWVDRVYANGLAYGVGEHNERHWGDRYGQGSFSGKRAMLMVTLGGWASHYSPRGVNGPIEDLLFPIQHGILYYPGFTVLPPYLVFQTYRVDETRYEAICAELAERLDQLETIEPIRFRSQNGGDYSIPDLILRDELAAGREGLGIHRQ